MSVEVVAGGPAPQTPRDISGQKKMRPGEVEIAEAIRAAEGPLRIVGSGTRDIGVPVEGAALDATGTAGIRLYEPGALTLVAGAGTPLAEIETTLAGEGQRLAFEPPDWRALLGTDGKPTLGGVVATNASGPRRVSSVGACRDAALGVRFVDGTGRVVSNGGRVMKNVTGYDLVRLMCGSWGTLGVLTEVGLKVLPAPETEATLVIPAADAGAGLAAMTGALGSPFEVTGAAWGPLGEGGAPVALLRIEGFADQVRYRTGALRDRLGMEADSLDAGASAELWRGVRDAGPLHGSEVVVRLSARPSLLPQVAEALGPVTLLADWGGGLVWAGTDAARGAALLARARSFVEGHGGHATLWKAPTRMRGEGRVFQPEAAPIAALSAGLRAQFDPKGRLNPGLMA